MIATNKQVDDAVLNINIPEDTKIYVNGTLTKTKGTSRSYVSRDLEKGKSYSYEIRAEADQDGQLVSRTKVVALTAGANKTIEFDFDDAPLVTSITLSVPEDAIVELCGRRMKSTGPLRHFSSDKLKAGQSWNDYRITVKYEIDGKMVSRTKTLDIQAGDSRSFEFGTERDELIVSR